MNALYYTAPQEKKNDRERRVKDMDHSKKSQTFCGGIYLKNSLYTTNIYTKDCQLQFV